MKIIKKIQLEVYRALNGVKIIFPEFLVRVPVSFWGCGGRRIFAGYYSTVRNRPQPSAPVRNRSRDCHMAVPIGSFPGVVIFGRFTCCVTPFGVTRVALRNIWTYLVMYWKSFCVINAIFLRYFQKICYLFRGRRSISDVSNSIFRSRRNISDISYYIFVGNRIGTAVRSSINVKITWQTWYFLISIKIRRKTSQ